MDIMLDIETLATHKRAPIIEIAAVKFDAGTIYPNYFHYFIKPDFSRFPPDNDTLLFWLEQPRPMPLSKSAPLEPIVLDRLTEWMGLSIGRLWANSPSFDLAILSEHYLAYGMPIPWRYRAEWDFRTLRRLAELLDYPVERQPATHEALDDAIQQAKLVQAIWKGLSLGT